MGETLYWFKSRALCFQFRDTFATYFPHTNLELQLQAIVN